MKSIYYISIVAALALPTGGLPTGATESAVPQARNVARADLVPFSSWAARYTQAADPAEKNRMLVEGVRLAKERRATLSSLIESDPQQALTSVLSRRTLRALPRQITDQFETSVSGIGDLEVLCPFPDQSQRVVEP